jgi:hypothetical protein
MPHHYRQQRQANDSFVGCEVASRPDRECSFANITQNGQQEAGPSQNTADIPRANIAAACLANIYSLPKKNKVIAGGDATQSVRPQCNAARLTPVGRLQLFHPGHILYLTDHQRFRFWHFRPNLAIPRGMGTKKWPSNHSFLSGDRLLQLMPGI